MRCREKTGLTAIEVLAWDGSSYASLGVKTPTETDGVLAIEFPVGEYEKLKFRFTGSVSAAEMLLGLTDEDAVNYLAERLTGFGRTASSNHQGFDFEQPRRTWSDGCMEQQ